MSPEEEGGVDALVVEPYMLINQVCLEAGKELPEQQVESNVTLQVVSGEGVCQSSGKSVRLGPGKLLRIRLGAFLKIRNESQERLCCSSFIRPTLMF
jgi:quercetin dioxygenase-like cupin family protein